MGVSLEEVTYLSRDGATRALVDLFLLDGAGEFASTTGRKATVGFDDDDDSAVGRRSGRPCPTAGLDLVRRSSTMAL